MRYAAGLVASPPARHILEVARGANHSLFAYPPPSPNLIHRRRHLFCCVDFLVKSAGRIQNRLTGNQMVAYYVMELNGSLLGDER